MLSAVPTNVFVILYYYINTEIAITCRMGTNAYKIAHEIFLKCNDTYEDEE